jgi:hypothetical protein
MISCYSDTGRHLKKAVTARCAGRFNCMSTTSSYRADWLPEHKAGAVCFSIDDVHPGRSSDAYEAGGDLASGALGHVEWLLQRHPLLRVTLFVTADWRQRSPVASRKFVSRIPGVRERSFLGGLYPPGVMRLDRHPDFVRYLTALPRTEVALHGLHHVARGRKIGAEFQGRSLEECRQILRTAAAIFDAAGLQYVRGLNPPLWDLPVQLAEASIAEGLTFVASARDIITPVSPTALTAMSGLRGVSLIYPEPIYKGRILHIPTNFQATTSIDRALEIVRDHGVVCVKAHIVKDALSHVALDGMDLLYRNYLDVLFSELERRYGDSLWWTSMGEIADRFVQSILEWRRAK